MEMIVINNTGTSPIVIENVTDIQPQCCFGWKVGIDNPVILICENGQCIITHNQQQSQAVYDSNGDIVIAMKNIWTPDILAGNITIPCGIISDKININGSLVISEVSI